MLMQGELVWLLGAVAKGDAAAFERLYDATRSKLYGVLLRILGRPELAEEVMQETYLKVWKMADRFDPVLASPITWMEMYNDLRSDPAVREHYQFWFYLYPTGQPFWTSGSRFREDLAELREDQSKSHERAEHAEFLEHGQIADTRLLAFALRKFQTRENEKEGERGNQNQSENQTPVSVAGERDRAKSRPIGARQKPADVRHACPARSPGAANSAARGISAAAG